MEKSIGGTCFFVVRMRSNICGKIYLGEMNFFRCSVSTAKSRFRLGVAHLKKLMEVDYEGEGNQSSFFAGR